MTSIFAFKRCSVTISPTNAPFNHCLEEPRYAFLGSDDYLRHADDYFPGASDWASEDCNVAITCRANVCTNFVSVFHDNLLVSYGHFSSVGGGEGARVKTIIDHDFGYHRESKCTD